MGSLHPAAGIEAPPGITRLVDTPYVTRLVKFSSFFLEGTLKNSW